MDYKQAVKRKNACISTMLILIIWAFGHLKVSKDSIIQNPDTVGLAFLLAYGLPILVLFILGIIFGIKAKQTEFDDLDE